MWLRNLQSLGVSTPLPACTSSPQALCLLSPPQTPREASFVGGLAEWERRQIGGTAAAGIWLVGGTRQEVKIAD
ncbi:unnamed protein product [Linum trigynum]|uniref:Uncharacterized protein n=1 Tax=Linum trigynum TaxID=586398 RepID=A0AAV2GHM5_9ROSI